MVLKNIFVHLSCHSRDSCAISLLIKQSFRVRQSKSLHPARSARKLRQVLVVKMAARARLSQIGAQFRRISSFSAVKKLQSGGSSFYSTSSSNGYDKFYGNQVYLDTLERVRSLEAQGIPSNHAEAITSAMTLVLDHILENMSLNIISREIQKIEMTREANLSKLKSELQSSQDRHFTLLRNEIEKLGLEMNKVAAELRVEKSNGMNKLCGEIHDFGADLEASKKDLRKFVIVTVIAITAAVTGMRRMLSKNN